MIPAVYDLTLYRGDTQRWQFKLWADALKTVPITLTAATADAEIKDRVNGVVVGTLVCSVELPNIIDVVLPADVAAGLSPSGVWDLQVHFATGGEWTPVAGKVKCTLDVTSPAA